MTNTQGRDFAQGGVWRASSPQLFAKLGTLTGVAEKLDYVLRADLRKLLEKEPLAKIEGNWSLCLQVDGVVAWSPERLPPSP